MRRNRLVVTGNQQHNYGLLFIVWVQVQLVGDIHTLDDGYLLDVTEPLQRRACLELGRVN